MHFYVGLDVHIKSFVVCVLNSNGQVVQRQCFTQVEQLLKFLQRYTPFAICYEVSSGYGWLYEALLPLAKRIVVAHPGHLNLIFKSKKKNDRRDAEKLAKLLFLDAVPTVHVPSADVRSWRELINFRRKTVEKRTAVKNQIRALLRSVGVKPPARPGLWTKKGREWLKNLEFAQSLYAFKRDTLLDELERTDLVIKRTERELAKFSKDNVAVKQLRSIPGVGLRTAEAMVAFLDDPHRFRNAKKVGAYFGLVPCQDQSASKNRLGHITREGAPTVRKVLVEATWQAVQRSPTIKAFYERLHQNNPKRRKISLVATAHYLVRVMWAMLRDGTLWKETVKTPAAAA